MDDYDTPWDSNQRLNKVFNKLITTPSEKDGQDCFPNLNSSQIGVPSLESNLNNLSATTTVTTPNPVNLNPIQQDNVDKNEETINVNDNISLKVDEQLTNQSQLNQQRKGSNGSTHSSNNSSSFSINTDQESNVCNNESCSSSPNEPVKVDLKPDRPRKLSLPLSKLIILCQLNCIP